MVGNLYWKEIPNIMREQQTLDKEVYNYLRSLISILII